MRINRIRIPLLAENADSLARFYKDYFHFEIVLDQVLADGTRKLYLQNENISSVRLDVISRQANQGHPQNPAAFPSPQPDPERRNKGFSLNS
jgi:hypothetical protein